MKKNNLTVMPECQNNMLQGENTMDGKLGTSEDSKDMPSKEVKQWDHDTLTALSNLASMLEDQGRYENALTMYQDALLLYREVLGERHLA